MEQKELVRRIREIGFSCRRCGECCHSTGGDANLVMVFPDDIKELTGATGQKAEDFSQPYPENVCTSGGGSITFEWCLKRTLRGCIFLDGDRCTAYASRPWICRTYPFMLSGDSLSLFPCNDVGGELSEDEAEEIAGLLIARRDAEQEEEEQVRAILSSQSIPAEKNVLVDGTGIRVL